MTVTAPRQCAGYGVCSDPRLIRGAQDELLGRLLISPAVQCKGDSIMRPARSILDTSFRYVPSFSTSVASTWRRAGWRPTEEQRTAQQRSGPSTSTRAALYLVDAAPRRADVALVLADKWQGRALGRRLLATLLEHAHTAGVREAVGVVLATNKAMLRLARSMGFAVTAEPGDATVVRIRRDLRILNAQPH